MLEGVWSIHSHNTHLIQISQYKWWYLLTNFSNHLYSRISQDISSLDICTIDSNGTGGYSLHFTAVFMRAVLPTSVYDNIVYDSIVYDSIVYDSIVYESSVYDSIVYDSIVYDSIVYDSIVYDSIVYDSIATDGLTRLPALPVYIPAW